MFRARSRSPSTTANYSKRKLTSRDRSRSKIRSDTSTRRSRSRSRCKSNYSSNTSESGFFSRSRSRNCNYDAASLNDPSRNKTGSSERSKILSKWRKEFCYTSEDISKKMEELSNTQEDTIEKEKKIWTRTTPADLHYMRDEKNSKIIKASDRLLKFCNKFSEELVLRAQKVNELKPKYEPPPRKNRARLCKHKCKQFIGIVVMFLNMFCFNS